MNKHNTASMQNGKKRPSFSILPEKPDGAEDWFYTFMCMNIPFYGWRYLKQLVYQEPNDSPKSQFARAYLYYKRVFLRISLAIAALLAVIGFAGLHLLIRYMEMLKHKNRRQTAGALF